MTDTPLLDWARAQRKADVGMTQAVDRADRLDPNWSGQARAALRLYCMARPGEQFTAESARATLHAGGLPLPPDGRAWGSIFKMAAKRGWLTRVGYAPRACGNMTPTIVWRAKV